MQTNTLTSLKNVPGIGGLSIAIMLLGFATSFAQPYLSLFGVTEIGMSPIALGFFLTTIALSSIVISTLLGRLSDRLPSRKPVVLLSVACAALGYTLYALTENYLLLLTAVVFIGTGAASFPQLFALAKAQAGTAGEQSMTALRSLFSLAWVVGPGIGAALLAAGGFRGLFLTTAACFALAAVPILRTSARAREAARANPVAPAPPSAASGTDRPVALVALSFVLYGTSMHMGSVALPIHVTQVLHGTTSDVGLLVGLCALLEIPVMLSFVVSARRLSNEKLILWGIALFVLYFVLVLLSPSVWWLAVAQAVRAVVIAILATLGMAYVQELMPDRVGVATTLYANTMNAGALLGGLGVGLCAQFFGYTAVFVLCALLSVASWALLLATRRGLGKRTPAPI
ncbi:sugar efflux transporter [Deinococcus peraridilitoris]|uniref:Arabinose efflux permease family protein n=1 Tax=Deinococcus peraridilitoris (strain DSM 19664 / LMG 22246 / CIP 109416 / KR-200) TaxID=937777 RepID=L0A517_DEIPD|nr:MFS transporter [Deinococcus peraridilitoris]AFZ68090.1 arabinose efflux permease family protein [Deinococcus peraridilitoris DSM 19664]